MKFRLAVSLSGLLPVLLLLVSHQEGCAAERPNVLFIAVDDLRPELACYGASHMQTPAIDRLAANGILFEKAYCQVAVCGASRASLMSGCRPETTNCWNYKTPLREKMPDVLTLPGAFQQAGYTTTFLGKVYHSASDDQESWSLNAAKIAALDRKRNQSYAGTANKKNDSKRRPDGTRMSPSVENGGDVPDNAYRDGHNADRAIKVLRHLKKDKNPFFFAVGFSRPHLPFTAPAKYWDLYDRDSIVVPAKQDVIDGVPYAGSTWGELKNYSDIPRNVDVLSDEKSRELIHGYYAATSYVDAQIGRVIQSLADFDLDHNTIVVLWGDHGWYVGDFGDWCKHTNYEVATRVPLIISIPESLEGTRGRTKGLAELVDLYPTLCELTGLPVPDHCQGHSLKPLLQAPGRNWKAAAFSQYYKGKRGSGTMLGTSVRTDRFRYTEWRSRDSGELDAVELFDFQTDPGATRNVAGDSKYQQQQDRLAELAARSGTGTPPPSEY